MINIESINLYITKEQQQQLILIKMYFNIDEIYHSNADFYKVIRRTRCFIYLQQVNDEFKSNGKMRKNWIHKTIKRKVKTCGHDKVSIFQLEYEGEFITLGLNSKHDNLFSSNAFWKIELRRSLLETKTQFDVKVST